MTRFEGVPPLSPAIRLLAGALALVGALALGSPDPARAQQADPHVGHNMPASTAPQAGASAPSSTAYLAANARMHKDMDIAFSGNADLDFIRGMIAHHQGAIDMAKVELQFGNDAMVRTLAEEIIKAQETEIAWMKAWLEKNAPK
jgi:uncharacterized protein (DUF305 family)